jgi:ribosomal protein S18 acetylase RimI-like enzyme
MPGKRLGKMLLAKSMHAMRDKNFHYADFDCFAALADNQALATQLILSYQSIFGNPDGWAEHYTSEEVLYKLTNELSGKAELRICVDDAGLIAGFCWAQVLGVEEIADAIGTIKYYQSSGSPDVVNHLRQHFGERRVIYLHDLGIDSRYRGRIPLTQLIYPVLDTLAKRTGVDTVLFWSVSDTNISKLAKRALFDRILALDEMRFYSGTLWASKTRPKDFAAE